VKRVYPREKWPLSWKQSYGYDRSEIYYEITCHGYFHAYRWRREKTLEFVTEALEPDAKILDIAAAQGNFSLALAEMGYDVTWNDLRAELADYVREKYDGGRITFTPGNAFELNFPSLFDGILITEVIEHVAHPDQFLARIGTLLKPGGYIIMTTPNGAYFRNNLPKFSDCADPGIYEKDQFRPDSDGHIFLLYPEEIAQLAHTAGLHLDRLELFTNPLTAGHIKLEKMLRLLPKAVIDGLEHASQHMPNLLARKLLVQIAARFRRSGESRG
jgi:2-polyprenyl-6-hydroxyphenyl methylase/3-demethylubiquinone-9 3-methyltransferase